MCPNLNFKYVFLIISFVPAIILFIYVIVGFIYFVLLTIEIMSGVDTTQSDLFSQEHG